MPKRLKPNWKKSMAFEVLVSGRAAIEIDDAIDWYQKISPDLGSDIFDKYVQARKAIKSNPLLFQELKGGYRKVIIERFPYKVIFKIVDIDSVLILAFTHHKRSNYWNKR